MKLSDLPFFQRPREKLIAKGVENLSNIDLIAILLRTGNTQLNVLELSKKILTLYPIEKLLSLKYSDLISLKGIDSGKASSLLAAFELGRRALNRHDTNLPLIQKPQDIVDLISDIAKLRKEYLLELVYD